MILKKVSYGRWKIIDTAPRRKSVRYYFCECNCALHTRKEVCWNNLRNGSTQSCGCLQKEVVSATGTTHGQSGTVTYVIWSGLKERCLNKNHHAYASYGGRGIKVCKRYQTFEGFFADLGERPPKLTVDRINNNGHYSCGKCQECIENGWLFNCRWATRREQGRNRRTNNMITYQGRTQCVLDWAIELGINYATIITRIDRYKWSIERALSTPGIRGRNQYTKNTEQESKSQQPSCPT